MRLIAHKRCIASCCISNERLRCFATRCVVLITSGYSERASTSVLCYYRFFVLPEFSNFQKAFTRIFYLYLSEISKLDIDDNALDYYRIVTNDLVAHSRYCLIGCAKIPITVERAFKSL